MIKLTRGALTMLLAQYRGILKNAWIKNFAVAAALATSVSSAYAVDVTTWEDAVKTGEGAVALDGTTGVLNIQTSAKWKENPGTITITGGVDHKIGSEDGKNVSIFAEKENSEKPPVGSIVINTTGENASNAKLTIANKQTDTKTKTGVRIYSAEVKAGSEDSKPTANLTVSTMPNIGPDYIDDEEQYVNIEKLTVDGKNASVNVTGELDVNNQLTITNGAKVEVESGILWMGNCGHDVTSVNVEDGTLTSASIIVLDSTKLKVGDKGQVNVKGFLNLADANEVNINKDLDARKINLTGKTTVTADKLVLNAAKTNVEAVTAKELTLGSDEYDNSGIGANATVSKKLTALTADEDGKKVAYKIKTDESITLNTEAEFIGLDDISNEGNGTVASDLEVAGGNLNVQAGEWTAKNITVSAGALNVNGKSLAADGLTVKDGTATVEGNATLALKTLDIANGQTLTVKVKGSNDGDVDGVLDLTKTTLVNATGKEATAIKGTIANAGVVKITGEKLQGAIANVTGAEEKNNLGYIFDNTGVIEVAGPTTLATGAFLADISKSGIKNAGTLAVDGALTVNGEKDKASELKNAGKITASSLTLKGMDYDKSKDERTNNGALFTVTDGTYNIAGTVSTGSDLKIGKNATVNAQSLEAHTIDVEGGKVGSAEKPLTSIKAGGEFTSLAGSKVFAGTISAEELVDLDGDVTADKITSGDKFTVTNGTHNFGEVSSAKDFTVTAGSLTLGDVTAANINVTAGSVGVKGALSTDKFTQEAGSVTVTNGSFTAKETTAAGLTLAGASTANLGALTATAANGLKLQDTASATIKSYAGKVDSTEAATGSVVIGQGTTLTVSDSLANNTAGDAIKVEGTLDVSTSVLGLKAASDENTYETKVDFADASLIGILKINDANALFESGKISKEQLAGLKNAISKGDSDAAFNGKLALTGVSADLGDGATSDDAKKGSHTLNSVKDFADSLTGDAALNSATIDVGNGQTAVSGEFGNLIADANAGKVLIAEATLQGSGSSSATNGYYISAVKGDTGDDAKKVVLADAELGDGSSLTLAGAGKIGNIDAGADGKGKLTVNADVTAGNIGSSTNAIGELTVSSGTLTANAVSAKTTTVDGNLVADSLTAATKATINGSLTLNIVSDDPASGILTAATELVTGAKSSVSVDKIVATASAKLSGSVSASDIDTTDLTIGDSTAGSEKVGLVTVGKLSNATTAVKVNNGLLKVSENAAGVTLTVDKAGSASFDKNLTLADAAQTIKGELKVAGILTNGANKMTVGSVGANGATGSVYADTLLGTGGIFVDPDYGQRASGVASMHLDSATTPGSETTTQDIVVGKNAFVAVGVSSEAQARSVLSSLGLTDANGSFREDGVNNAIYTDALVKLNGTKLEIDSTNDTGTASGAAGQITLGDKSAVVIGKNAAAQSVKDRKAVLTADINGTGVTVAGKSKVIFAGNATKQDIKDVKVFGNEGAGNQVFADADEAAKVSVQLSPLYNEAKLTVDGGITDITVNRGYINTALYNASLPVKNLVAEVADTALTGDGVGSDFIMENALVDGGANIESAARLATFGGAYQAAAAAVNTGIDAAQARLGLGIDNSAEVKGEDISVWANAVYKNTESDSFEAQGANYGADLDLTSLVIGADYNMAEGSKVGAYATFGTGDVDGKGAGHNVKNDVDTYGFGIYGSAKLASGVSILSDVGYTVAQNEFKGIVNADADMKVFTAGANVKYTFNTQVADISPFVGARYTSFNLESYAVKSTKGIVANTDADTAHIFSIPVGFDLSKQITAGEWNVKPAFTAKVTFNTGDKTVSSSTQFTGVKNTLNLDAEVMDDVTYSVGASVSAAKGAATFGAGLSYTGSSETNELSAQIGARYTF